MAQRQDVITWFESVNHLNRRPDASLSVMRRGERFEVAQAGALAELSRSYRGVIAINLGDAVQAAWLSRRQSRGGSRPTSGTTRATLTSIWPDSLLSGNSFLSDVPMARRLLEDSLGR